MSENNQNGWSEYSRLVLKELETLASNLENLTKEIQEVKQEIAAIRAEDKAGELQIAELKEWKSKVDEVVSPAQLKETIRSLDDLKTFKTKAITIFAVVQFLMAAAIFAKNIF